VNLSDTGSPEAALGKIRAALAQMAAAGGCPKAEEPNACQETRALARKAIAALEACTSTSPPEKTVDEVDSVPTNWRSLIFAEAISLSKAGIFREPLNRTRLSRARRYWTKGQYPTKPVVDKLNSEQGLL
jgi:hypothetical protein